MANPAELPPEERPADRLSPEARREAARRRVKLRAGVIKRVGPGTRFFQVLKRVAVGAYNDGFIHAGNLAYMSVLAIFPFFVTGAAIFKAIGEEAEQTEALTQILTALPPVVREVIEPVARDVIEARTGWLLWAGGAFGLWTVSSLIETIRDILRRAYGTEAALAFWRYRLLSVGIIVVAVVILLLSLIAQVLLGAAQEFIQAFLPQLDYVMGYFAWGRIIPALGLFGSIYLLFQALTPQTYRSRHYPKWPGALTVTIWWVTVSLALPPLLANAFTYDLTYGSLAGIMIALLFFYVIGFGVVIGAELNAALAETPEEAAERVAAERAARENDDE